MTLNAYVKANHKNENLVRFRYVADRIVKDPKFILDFNSQGIANTLNAFAESDHKNEELFKIIADRIVKEPKFILDLNSQEIAL